MRASTFWQIRIPWRTSKNCPCESFNRRLRPFGLVKSQQIVSRRHTTALYGKTMVFVWQSYLWCRSIAKSCCRASLSRFSLRMVMKRRCRNPQAVAGNIPREQPQMVSLPRPRADAPHGRLAELRFPCDLGAVRASRLCTRYEQA